MLDVEQWAQIRRMKHVEGLSQREIHRRTGAHRDTIRRALAAPKPPSYGPRPKLDLETEAQIALEEARVLPPGAERTEAMKRAGILRNAADMQGILFAKRGRPPKM